MGSPAVILALRVVQLDERALAATTGAGWGLLIRTQVRRSRRDRGGGVVFVFLSKAAGP
jgi:hypothetical protein